MIYQRISFIYICMWSHCIVKEQTEINEGVSHFFVNYK